VDGDTLVAAIHDGDFRRHVAQNRRLLQRFGERVTVVRIARHRAHANYQSFLVRRRDRHFYAELVWGAGFALRQTFNFRRV